MKEENDRKNLNGKWGSGCNSEVARGNESKANIPMGLGDNPKENPWASRVRRQTWILNESRTNFAKEIVRIWRHHHPVFQWHWKPLTLSWEWRNPSSETWTSNLMCTRIYPMLEIEQQESILAFFSSTPCQSAQHLFISPLALNVGISVCVFNLWPNIRLAVNSIGTTLLSGFVIIGAYRSSFVPFHWPTSRLKTGFFVSLDANLYGHCKNVPFTFRTWGKHRRSR